MTSNTYSQSIPFSDEIDGNVLLRSKSKLFIDNKFISNKIIFA